MSGWLYLIRNRDLYKIGITKNFENRMRQLKPDNVVAKFYTADFVKLERELHNRYKSSESLRPVSYTHLTLPTKRIV